MNKARLDKLERGMRGRAVEHPTAEDIPYLSDRQLLKVCGFTDAQIRAGVSDAELQRIIDDAEKKSAQNGL